MSSTHVHTPYQYILVRTYRRADIPTWAHMTDGHNDGRTDGRRRMPIVQNTTVPSKPRTSAKQRTTPPFLSFPRSRRRRTHRPTDKPTNGRTTSANSSKYLSHFTAYRPNQEQAQTNEHLPRLYRSHAAAADGTIYRRIDISMYVRVDGKSRQIKAPIFYRTLYCSNQATRAKQRAAPPSPSLPRDCHRRTNRRAGKPTDGRRTGNECQQIKIPVPPHTAASTLKTLANKRTAPPPFVAPTRPPPAARHTDALANRRSDGRQNANKSIPIYYSTPYRPNREQAQNYAQLFRLHHYHAASATDWARCRAQKPATPPWFGAFRCRQGQPLGHKTQP